MFGVCAQFARMTKPLWLVAALTLGLCWGASPTFAKKTNQAVYEEPFDLAGGGASLTRASQEGILFANPALLPYGEKIYRWIGLKTNFIVGKESIDLANQMKDGESADTSSMLESIYEHPVHLGASGAFSVLTRNVGGAAFYRFEPDLSAKKYGESGLPEVRFQAEGYGGGALALATRPLRWLSLGVTGKYLYAAEPDIAIGIADQSRIKELSSQSGMREAASYGKGIGYDAGALLFLQGDFLDLSVAGKVDDIGGTTFDGTQEPFKQTMSSGVGLTLHSEADAIHFAVDYRDITGAYEESRYKRLYMGTKVTIRTYVGFAAGLYQGYPTYGTTLDLIFLRLSATMYGREYGAHPDLGVERRNLYVVSLAAGF